MSQGTKKPNKFVRCLVLGFMVLFTGFQINKVFYSDTEVVEKELTEEEKASSLAYLEKIERKVDTEIYGEKKAAIYAKDRAERRAKEKINKEYGIEVIEEEMTEEETEIDAEITEMLRLMELEESVEVSFIPDKFSPKSVLSVCGILFLIFCLIPFRHGILWGMGTNGVILAVSLLFYILLSSSFSCMEARFLSVDGKISVSKDNPDFGGSYIGDDDIVVFNGKSFYRGEGSEIYFAMHCPDYEGFTIKPWFFHPGAFLFIPCLFCLPVIVLGMSFKGRNS